MDAEKTGRLIRRLREEKGMTQVQLGERLHISHKTVSNGRPEAEPRISACCPLWERCWG